MEHIVSNPNATLSMEDIPALTPAPLGTCAFLGIAQAGPLNEPVRLNSIFDFLSTFGDFSPAVEVSYAIAQFFANGGREAWFVRVGRDTRAADLIGNTVEKNGLHALDSVNGLNMLSIPGIANLPEPELAIALDDTIRYCQERRTMLLFDLPSGVVEPLGVKRWLTEREKLRHPNVAIYFPRVRIADPKAIGATRLIGSSGTVAGVLARNDLNQNIWRTPSGIELQVLGAAGLGYNLTEKEIGLLNSCGVNSLRKFEAAGTVLNGFKTLMGADHLSSQWNQIPVRRLALFIQESLHQGTGWVGKTTVGEELWVRLARQIHEFMLDLFQAGAFAGTTPEDSFLVQCDQTLNPPANAGRGLVNVLVGFAPTQPRDFYFIKLCRKAKKGS